MGNNNHPNRDRRIRPGPLMAPNGLGLAGYLSTVAGYSGVAGLARRMDGSVTYNVTGETFFWWEEIETVLDRGHNVFVDEHGGVWRADQLVHTEAKNVVPDAKSGWAGTTHITDLLEALRAILPYAHSHAEDMNDTYGDANFEWRKADIAIKRAYRLIGEAPP